MVAAYARLRSLRLVAAELGVDRSTVRVHLKERGVVFAEKARMAPQQIARAVELYAAGQNSGAIGKVLGSTTTRC